MTSGQRIFHGIGSGVFLLVGILLISYGQPWIVLGGMLFLWGVDWRHWINSQPKS